MAETVTVNWNGTGDYTSIQSAIDNASSGDSIIVMPGIYAENLLVDRSVSIVSESGDPDDTAIMAADQEDDVIHVTADNVTISGFNITRSDLSYIDEEYPDYSYSGILLDHVESSLIMENELSHNYRGISLDCASNNFLANNSAFSNIVGLYLDCSNDNTLVNNSVFSNNGGFVLDYSNENTLTNNSVTSKYGGISLFWSKDCSLLFNRIESCGTSGISFHDSSNTTLTGNNIKHCDYGINIETLSKNSRVTHNDVTSNNYGIYLFYAYNTTICDNNVSDNSQSGFFIRNSLYNTLNDNIICNNSEYGVHFKYYAHSNLIYNNYFNNTNNSKDEYSNVWNLGMTSGTNIAGGPYLGGNFWASPDGTGFSQTQEDLDGDGICDGIYVIEGGSVDNLPLTNYQQPVPTASILCIYPDNSYNGDAVFFYGKGNSLFSPIVAYNWTSSIDGHLSDSASFSTSNLFVGAHTICLSVQNSVGEWSDSVSSILIVDSHRPTVKTVFESQLGGLMNKVYVSGNYAYVAQGQSLVVVNLSNTSELSEVGRMALPSEIQDIVIEDNYAYIADGESGLVIVDIENPAEPLLTSILGIEYFADSSFNFAYSIDISGDYAYIAADGTIVVDISDPGSPKRIGGYYYIGSANAIEVYGNYVYVSIDDMCLAVFDASNPSDLNYLGCYSYNYWVWDICIADNYAYLATDSKGLKILNISNPSNLKSAGSYEDYDCVMGVGVIGNLTYMAVANDSLIIVDVTDPDQPQLKSIYQSGFGTDIAVCDDYAYLTTSDNGLCVINISDSSNPEYANTYETTGFISDVDVNDNYAFCMPLLNDAIGIIDLTESNNPKDLDIYSAGNFTDFSVNDSYMYLTDSDHGLIIVNISDPTAATLEGSFHEDALLNVTVFGNYAYVLSENNFSIINVSDPASPSLAGSYNEVHANYVTVYGNYAYLADIEGGLIIIDVSDSASPSLTGTYGSRNLVCVAVSGNYAYLADSDNGLVVIDVSDPAAPSYIHTYDTIIAHDIAIAKNYLYAANGDIVVLDISIPWLPSIVDIYYTAGYASGVDAEGIKVYVADSYNGLVVLKNEEVSESESDSGSDSDTSGTSTASTSTSSGGGGGGGGGGTTGELYENIAFKDVRSEFVTKDSVTSYNFEDNNNELEYIQFTASRNWGKISATIECLHGTSALVDKGPEGTVYRNLNIWVGKSGFSDSITDCTIGFKVSKEWLDENEVDEDSVRLLHYSGGEWEELDTELVDEDDEYLHFEARTPGFSPFAIVGDSKRKALDAGDANRSTDPVDEETISDEDLEGPASKNTPAFECIVSMLAFLLAGYYMVHRKKS
ncbi:PGF-pre-PGF domain-containing protein [uncultured Methanolobus sp.]|uniref:PGF-pre-PGF domain-containing protein n=1 Tax=uncultured Methanolobus sp. TaxID=218300 RepID=UPI0029C7A576|nr:PGF-pre-PGF domain-containing protein [uncultured Methanolobus sp.]